MTADWANGGLDRGPLLVRGGRLKAKWHGERGRRERVGYSAEGTRLQRPKPLLPTRLHLRLRPDPQHHVSYDGGQAPLR